MIIERDSHNLLYDTSYGWISIVTSRTQRELASLATSMRSETHIADKNTGGKGGRRLWQNLEKRDAAPRRFSGSQTWNIQVTDCPVLILMQTHNVRNKII